MTCADVACGLMIVWVAGNAWLCWRLWREEE